jgi:ubiquinone/menaquinone biosynthesis C-methylase UbiE
VPAWWALVRFAFRLLYNELAFTYDWVSKFVSFGAWRCWQRQALAHLAPVSGPFVLELAHGTGDLQLDLHAAGYRTVGYDLSPAMGRIAHAKLKRKGIAADLVRGTAGRLPFADTTFSAVISTFPTDFIVAPDTLREVHRVLRADGRLIIVPNAVFTGGGVSKNMLDWLYRITGQRGDTQYDVRPYFEPHGFAVQVVQMPCPRSLVTVVIAQKKP